MLCRTAQKSPLISINPLVLLSPLSSAETEHLKYICLSSGIKENLTLHITHPTPAPLRLPRYNTLMLQGQETPPAGWESPESPYTSAKKGLNITKKWCNQPDLPRAGGCATHSASSSCILWISPEVQQGDRKVLQFPARNKAQGVPLLETFKARLNGALSKLISWKVSLPMTFKDPIQTQLF